MARKIGVAISTLLLMSCATPKHPDIPAELSFGPGRPPQSIAAPPLARRDTPAPKPAQTERSGTFSVVVSNIAAQDLLFSLARDAKINIDIHPGITGAVTLHAIDQTLPQLLKRISRQIDMRYELDGTTLTVMPDTPYLKTYKVDHVNMTRDTAGTVAVTTQVASGTTAASAGNLSVPVAGNLAGANNSITRVENKAQNHFWETITRNIREILHETDKILPEGSSETVVEQATAQTTSGTGTPPPAAVGRRGASTPSLASSTNPATLQNSGTTVVRRTTFREAASVIAHPESGVLSVRATSHQHEKIQEFLNKVTRSSHRQVLIEAMVTEVRLSRDHQQGIDWSAMTLGRSGFSVAQKANGAIAAPPSSLLQLSYNNLQSRAGAIRAAITLLEGFGTVKVLSSPKLAVMNNQTAVIKVVDNNVYFTLKADTIANTNTTTTTFTTTLQSVPVGFVMNVTPQISDADSVMLNIRPSISSVIDYVADPNPSLANPCGFGTTGCAIPPIESRIPVVRTREMESMLRVDDGNIAVMGGLIEDRIENIDNTVPGLSRLPVIGELFKQRRDQSVKTELVIFLRPTILRDATPEGNDSVLKSAFPSERGALQSSHPEGMVE